MEYRIKDVNLQCEENGLLKIGGYINVTERESEMLYSKKRSRWFKETMKKGVFERAIQNGRDIPLLLEHDWDKKLATTSNNSLSLREDNIGLRFDAVIEDEKTYDQVKAGIINSCSFGFKALEEEIQTVNNKFEKRFVNEIELLEVSLVKNPAYVGSLVESRAYQEERKKSEDDSKDKKEEESKDDDSIKNDPVKDSKDESKDEKEKESKKEESKNKKEDSKEEDSKDNDSKKTEEESEDDKKSKEKRTSDGFTDETLNSSIENDSRNQDSEEVKKILDEVIEEKKEELVAAELIENGIANEIEYVNQIQEQQRQSLNDELSRATINAIKLKLQILKLKTFKDGI